jgi:choline kinase
VVSQCIILAAGVNSRLPLALPKSLIELDGETLLGRHIRLFSNRGVTSFFVVVGNNEEVIAPYLATYKEEFEVDINVVVNPDFKKQNGYSVYHALKSISGRESLETYLTMGDHYFSEAFLDDFTGKITEEDKELILAVDFPSVTNQHIDFEDVTKVMLGKQDIINIGKEISEYTHYDTGLFRIRKSFEIDLAGCFRNNKTSISDGVKALIGREQAGAIIVSHHFWNDIDTPLDLEATKRLIGDQS